MRQTPTHHVSESEHDVVIVGCGPTGATLANFLAQSGLNVLVLDREHAVYDLPRAVHFDDETMRVFQAVGISDELEKKIRVNPGMRFVDEGGSVLLDWPRPAGIGRHAWHTSYRLHQPDLERLLRAALERYGNCTLKLGHALLSFEQTHNAVELTYQEKSTGALSVCRASYVIGCDGANSTVRKNMHATMEDLGFRERWLVVDVLLKKDIPELGDYTVQYCSSEQPMTYCRNPGLRRRWEMALPDSLSDEHALDSSRIWSSLSRWITPPMATIERKAIYTFHSQLATQWRDGRAIIAGDAAHLTPPFMGQGMCTGIRDAANLAWKLTMVLRNECAEQLLDTYERERRPHAHEYITTAISLGKLIRSLEQEDVRSIASDKRDKAEWKMASINPTLGASDIVVQPFHLSKHAGRLLDQITLIDGTRFDDVLGYQHALIKRTDYSDSALSDSVFVEVRLADQEKLLLAKSDQAKLATLLQQLEVAAVLVRPDRYILATTKEEKDSAVLNWQSLLLTATPAA